MNLILNLLEALARAYASEERVYADFLKGGDEKLLHMGKQDAFETMAKVIALIKRKDFTGEDYE